MCNQNNILKHQARSLELSFKKILIFCGLHFLIDTNLLVYFGPIIFQFSSVGLIFGWKTYKYLACFTNSKFENIAVNLKKN